jgi:ergothioneine biosynthesis protein EgtB
VNAKLPQAAVPIKDHESIAARYARIRAQSLALAAPLSAEDCGAQSMPDASPVKWHIAHTTWFFETFVLERFERGFRPFDPAFRVLFNSYYNGIGEKHPRPERGLLTRPALEVVKAYRHDVDARMRRLLASAGGGDAAAPLAGLVVLGLNHEQQHQELLLTDAKHLLSRNPLRPAYRHMALPEGAASAAAHWIAFAGGAHEIGFDGTGFCFDNELPRHTVHIQAYRLASRPVSNADFLRFVEAGGYHDAQPWLSEGWEWVRAGALEHPLYWTRGEHGWQEFTLGGMQTLRADAPAVHLSFFEADAYARWAGARLPTEAEWEHAACVSATGCAGPTKGNFADSGALHPLAPSSSAAGLAQMFGDVWEWTQSSYAAYPGYRPAAGAIGEYNGKFMVNQYVLRGGSCATPAGHIRASYRNFFPAAARWQFSGLRLAQNGDNGGG